ncbi:NnrS family protein [Oharaeibacter diazotrophicus]|uniref:Uncharacterized protein involved in response to NO n=1 Tax=Oharaeibacter diazotrophicus TaxID=1920512 RepID=A0A4V3CWS2_9HYPH|nr:NnrS family protein [Oharaeibacter diazotrophicus]TDP87468.1 uncharacterized protein involved in response to NO [Oharaeibacter diazotrophicus]BBE70588.1 NnrS protein [Pleomorphomonas sp. SM30]GLS77334.1 short-chain dehydrogenase [Oharaeibacter diazotrophicus]
MATPHLLTGGFRPFFLLGALAMAASVLIWLPVFTGALALPTAFAPRDWHVHTMLFGGVMAIVAGFALTAVANWTGRAPIAGGELAALVGLWIAGRVAVSTSAAIGPTAALIADLLFPVALAAVFAREIVAAGNRRNLRVVAVVAALAAADFAFHVEAAATGTADFALRGAIALVLVLILLIGGRIVPAFTRNWLAGRGEDRLPAAFDRIDAASMAAAVLGLVAWTLLPEAAVTAAALAIAGVLAAVRLARWRGLATRSEPLLFVLHVAFAAIPLGFLAVAASILVPAVVDPVAAVHVWTVGAVGAMTLAVMTRASRGHSGRPLAAGRLEIAVFALDLVGTAARVAAPYAGGLVVHALDCAALAWAAAYLVFAVGYLRMLAFRPNMSRP